MSPVEVAEIGRTAIWVLLKTAAPVMIIALGVGLTISLLQALTQIQEMTLTFVPKIIVIFLTLLVMLPWMMDILFTFMGVVADRIINVR